MKWYGILAIVFIFFALGGIIYAGANTDKIGINFGESSYTSQETTNKIKSFVSDNDNESKDKLTRLTTAQIIERLELPFSHEEVKQKKQKKADRFIASVQKDIDSLEKRKNELLRSELLGVVPEIEETIYKIENRINYLQQAGIDSEKAWKKNPENFLSQNDLVDRAMTFYQLRPDGTACDEDKRWVEDRNNCIQRAEKEYFTWDLEWLREYPELDP